MDYSTFLAELNLTIGQLDQKTNKIIKISLSDKIILLQK